MEQRRVDGKRQWYHETQSRSQASEVLALVPEAAHVDDRFLLDLALPADLVQRCQPWLNAGRLLAAHLFPDTVTVTRLHSFSGYERLSTALTVAQVFGVQRLCNHYAARLAPLPGPDSSRESNHRLAQITQFARQLASSPSVIVAQSRQQLAEVGLSEPDILVFNQIIGFVGFQARIVAAFQAFLGVPVRWIPGMPVQDDAAAEPFSAPGCWQPSLAPVDLRLASALQLTTLTRCDSLPALHALAPLLAHDAILLDNLTTLASALRQDDAAGELVSLISARINGSVSCFNEASARWSGAPGLPEAVRNGDRAVQAWAHHQPDVQAVATAARLLTRAADRFSAAQFTPLTEQGFSAGQAIHLLAWCALCGWLNRLKIGLGQRLTEA